MSRVKQLLLKVPGIFAVQRVLYAVGYFALIFVFRLAYARKVWQIRRKARKGEKIEVLFLSANTSKWKCQSLFECMRESGVFHPRVAVTLNNADVSGMRMEVDTRTTLAGKVARDVAFFADLGDEYVVACDAATRQVHDLRRYRPDIVFFQEPGQHLTKQRVPHVGWYALCCYVPYSVVYFSNSIESIRKLQWHSDFHNLMFRVILWGDVAVRDTEKWHPRGLMSGRIVGWGHTILDTLQPREGEENEGYVIYAPHYSLRLPGVRRAFSCSTFLKNGMEILAYAQSRPEIKWVFKPHPNLFWTLVNQGGWSREQTENYYRAWEKVGVSCTDGSYPELFRKSKAMITDSCSFLFEYAITGHPLIWLTFKENADMEVVPEFRRVEDTFYKASDLGTLTRLLDDVVVNGIDSRCTKRLDELKKLGVCGVNAAANIVDHFERMFSA